MHSHEKTTPFLNVWFMITNRLQDKIFFNLLRNYGWVSTKNDIFQSMYRLC